MTVAAVSGGFDDLRCHHVRFLHEASRLGDLHVFLWSDQLVQSITGRPPKFPVDERTYFLQAIRYVRHVTIVHSVVPDVLPQPAPSLWVVDTADDRPEIHRHCEAHQITCGAIPQEQLQGFPVPDAFSAPAAKRVIVTGCYDWLHTGHVRFFEECSELGQLHVVVGHDANIAHLKGPGHPMFPQDLRRYMVGSIRYVHQAWVSSGMGWLDAEPEIRLIKPHIYAVNEDGDKTEKREFCRRNGIDYVVLKRLPKQGLQRRQSTTLRGF